MEETDPQANDRRQPDVPAAAVIRKTDRRRICFPASDSGVAGDVVSHEVRQTATQPLSTRIGRSAGDV